MFALAPRGRSARPSKLQPPIAGKDGDSLVVGRRVRTHPKGLTGLVRWVGPTHFSDGVWIGVELDTPDGRNDGEVQGTRYFNCTKGHGVFVRPDHCMAIKGVGTASVTSATASIAAPVSAPPPTPAPAPAKHQHRPRMNSGSSFSGEKGGLARTNSRSSILSDNGGGGVEVRRGSGLHRRGEPTGSSDGDEQASLLERLLTSEAFTRALDSAVRERVKTELAVKDSQSRVEEERVVARVDQLEQMVDDCGGAMDDIAVMIQDIHDKVSSVTPSSSSQENPDAQDAAGGALGGSSTGGKGSFSTGGDAGGGGRDDARVGYLTQLLSNVHIMSTQAADLLRAERKDKNARIEYLSNRVRDLEHAVSVNGRSHSGHTSGGGGGAPPLKPLAEPMEG